MNPNLPVRAWNFTLECGFIATLGQHSETHKLPRSDLLTRYIAALGKRNTGFDHNQIDALREIARHALAAEPVLQKKKNNRSLFQANV